MPTTPGTAPKPAQATAAGTATPAKKPRAKKAPSAASRYTATLSPVEGILAVLNDGKATGTHKYGLLLALIDLAPHVDPNTRTLGIDEIAETLLSIHWSHATVFPRLAKELKDQGKDSGDARPVLKQVNKGTPATVKAASHLNEEAQNLWKLREKGLKADNPDHTIRSAPAKMTYEVSRKLVFADPNPADPAFAQALHRAVQTWHSQVRAITRDTIRYPLQLLQVLPGRSEDHPDKFLYSINDDRPVTITLTPQALRDLITYGPVLRELVQARFAARVARINFGHDALEPVIADHLFGAERHMPPDRLRKQLLAMQRGVCLYTGKPIHNSGSVDHMVPWARVRISVAENFVVTTTAANSSKSAALLAPTLLHRWVTHIQRNHRRIAEAARQSDWPTDLDSVVSTARLLYQQPATGVWDVDMSSGTTFMRPMTPTDSDDALRHLTRLSA